MTARTSPLQRRRNHTSSPVIRTGWTPTETAKLVIVWAEKMTDTPPHLQALEEVKRAGIPGLLEVLREEGIDGVRYALWNVSGWHRDYSPPA